jgi:hypothetical protein
MRKRILWLVAAAAVAAIAGDTVTSSEAAARKAASCPAAWRTGWQKLANEVGAVVYCPTWMPKPLDARIGGLYANGRSVGPDHSYLVSFIWLDRDAGVSREVHVNFRGYPGRTAIPLCEDTLTVKGKTVRKPVPCFADAQGTRRVGALNATLYTANQGADEWHVLYAWRRDGSLYTISEHVAPPYTYAQVVRNLDRMLGSLVPVAPSD